MEKTIVLKLDKNSTKPVFEVQSECNAILSCMFDTGADISVWCSDAESLIFHFPSSRKTEYKFLIGGFGEGTIQADAYIIPEFRISNLVFKNFYVAVVNSEKFSWDLILGYSLFRKVDYSFINRCEGTPLLKIIYDKDSYHTNVKYNVNGVKGLVDNPYVFTEATVPSKEEVEDVFYKFIVKKKTDKQ